MNDMNNPRELAYRIERAPARAEGLKVIAHELMEDL